MNPREAAELLGHCAAFDNRKPSQAAAVAWAAALHDVPLDADARAAVASYYTTAPQDPKERLWILPHHVRTLRTKIRNERLENFQYEPLPDETVREFQSRLRGQIHAIASGQVPPPEGRPVLTGGPSRQLTDGMEARSWTVGQETPDSDEEALAEAVRRAGPLGVKCPACEAAIGRPCRTPGGTDKRPLGKPRSRPHAARLRAASGEPEVSPERRAAEEERQREAARAALARIEAEGEIVDAEIVEEGEAS